jgi:hypothetical protein
VPTEEISVWQAPRMWNKRFSTFLSALGFIASSSDPSAYIADGYSQPIYLILYVDDGLVFSRSEQLLENILKKI